MDSGVVGDDVTFDRVGFTPDAVLQAIKKESLEANSVSGPNGLPSLLCKVHSVQNCNSQLENLFATYAL